MFFWKYFAIFALALPSILNSFSFAGDRIEDKTEDEFTQEYLKLVEFSNQRRSPPCSRNRLVIHPEEIQAINDSFRELEHRINSLWIAHTGSRAVRNRLEGFLRIQDPGQIIIQIYGDEDNDDVAYYNVSVWFLGPLDMGHSPAWHIFNDSPEATTFFERLQNLGDSFRDNSDNLDTYLRWDRLSIDPTRKPDILGRPKRPVETESNRNSTIQRYVDNPNAAIFRKAQESRYESLKLMTQILEYITDSNEDPSTRGFNDKASFSLIAGHMDQSYFDFLKTLQAPSQREDASPEDLELLKFNAPKLTSDQKDILRYMDLFRYEQDWMAPIWPRLHSMLSTLRKMNLHWAPDLEELILNQIASDVFRHRNFGYSERAILQQRSLAGRLIGIAMLIDTGWIQHESLNHIWELLTVWHQQIMELMSPTDLSTTKNKPYRRYQNNPYDIMLAEHLNKFRAQYEVRAWMMLAKELIERSTLINKSKKHEIFIEQILKFSRAGFFKLDWEVPSHPVTEDLRLRNRPLPLSKIVAWRADLRPSVTLVYNNACESELETKR